MEGMDGKRKEVKEQDEMVQDGKETRELKGHSGITPQGSRYIFKPGCQYRIPTGQFPLFALNHY